MKRGAPGRVAPRRMVRSLSVFGAVVMLASCGGSYEGPPAEIRLETMDGGFTSVSDVSTGRPLLVSLWAVWCQPCRRELPELQAIWDADQGVDVLAVNVGDDPKRITEYLDEMSLDLPVAIDPLGDLLTALDVSTVPATVLFDTDGSILWSHLGAVTRERVEDALRTFVAAS